jgi:O-antigen ligase
MKSNPKFDAKIERETRCKNPSGNSKRESIANFESKIERENAAWKAKMGTGKWYRETGRFSSSELPISSPDFRVSSFQFRVAALAVVLGYAAFQWGGVARSNQFQFLLALGLLAIVATLARPRGAWGPLPGRAVRLAAAALPAYVLLQVVPLPVAALRVLSPARAEGVAALVRIGAKIRFASLSVSPAATFQSFLLVCGYVIVFLLVRELTWRSEDSCWLAIWPIVTLGALEAGLGLWQNFGRTGEAAQWGTYVNHNHYAGFLEMALPFAVMYPVALLRRARRRGNASLAPSLVACSVWGLGGLIFAGIVFSFSRMGFIAALFSLFVVGTLALGNRQLNWVAGARRRQAGAAGVVAALVLGGFVFLPSDKLILRFAEIASVEGLTAEGRLELWAETIPLIKAYPLFGCGLGGYETAVSKFKVSHPLVTDDYAHNDYLQLLAELGLVGFLIVAVPAFSVVSASLKKAVVPRNQEERYLAVACAAALAAILLHSLVDFNLYIPANAMLLAWIAGMAAGSGLPSPLPVWRPHVDSNSSALEAVEVDSCR